MFKFELPEQMTAVIVAALGEHPYRESAPVIAELQRQINNQMASRYPQANGNADPLLRPEERSNV